MSRPTLLLKCALLLLITLTLTFLLYADGVGDVIHTSVIGMSSVSDRHSQYSRVHHEIIGFVANGVDHSKVLPRRKHASVHSSVSRSSFDFIGHSNRPRTVHVHQTLDYKRSTGNSSVEVRCPQPIEPDMILPCNATSDPTCRKYLLPVDYFWLKNTTEKFRNKPYGRCRFMNGSRRAPVALASFPGSGNTWVRGLLEQATGICTG